MSYRNYYSSSYGRSRSDNATSRNTTSNADRPTAVTAKYINPAPSYKSSSIPILCRDRSNTRENESPITAIANRYANYKTSKDDKPASKYTDKKDSYNKVSLSPVAANRNQDISPGSTSSKYHLNRSSMHLTPDIKIKTASSILKEKSRDPSPADRDKYIPHKTEKSSGYSSISNYKLYPRSSSYTRPASRAESKPEISVNRYAIANKLATNYLRTPSTDRSRASVSPVSSLDISKNDSSQKSTPTRENTKSTTEIETSVSEQPEISKDSSKDKLENGINDSEEELNETVIVITRHTSPTPPGSSSYVRIRRADMAKTLEKTLQKSKIKPVMVDKEVQSDRLDDSTRTSRFASTARASVTNWSVYTPTISSYTGYAGRYSTQYNNVRDSSVSSSSSEKYVNKTSNSESSHKDNTNNSYSSIEVTESKTIPETEFVADTKSDIVTTYENNKDDDDTSEIIINVNLKLKKAKNPLTISSAELVSPEISSSEQRSFPIRRIRHVESGERPWWLSSSKNIPEGIEKLPTPPPQPESDDSSDSDEVLVYIPPFPLSLPDDEPLGDRRSPEGLETPRESDNFGGRNSPYENSHQYSRNRPEGISYQKPKDMEKYLQYTDIDDILGTSGQIYSPFMDSLLARRSRRQLLFDDMSECEEIDPTQVRIHDSTAQRPVIKKMRCRSEIADYHDETELDDAALQMYKDGDYGSYLDLDSTLGEQEEDLEGIQDSRKNSIVLRTQLPVRVHAIIERLLNSQGRELRRALFTLKAILQSDKDLVHEFVANKGLDCLIQVSQQADHNIYLDYILRALGQILLYVDGMHGVMEHKKCIQWLYSIVGNNYRHVKIAIKLLLVFVEYTESNSILLIDAIRIVDSSNGKEPWHNVMKILTESSDTELVIYAATLINRCLNNIPDRDTYYDQVDALQEQGFNDVIQTYMSKQGTNLDLLRQFQIFESVLLYEDGDETGVALKQLDDTIVALIQRRSLSLSTSDRRRSKKQQLKENGIQRYTSGLKQRIYNGTLGHSLNAMDTLAVIRQKQIENGCSDHKDDRAVIIHREHSIKDLAQRLTSPVSPTNEDKPSRVADMAGIVSKAKEELAKSQSKEVIKSPSIEIAPKVHEIKVSETDLHWEELRKRCIDREFHLCDLDFSELKYDSDEDMISPAINAAGIPPPPPPGMFPMISGLPLSSGLPNRSNIPAPPPNSSLINSNLSDSSNSSDNSTIKKNKKTVKLFWREIQDNPVPVHLKEKVGGLIWDDLPNVNLDTKVLEHLFESRTNDLIIKKLAEPKRNIILAAKRSNAINIAMKKLPTPRTIKAAIMKMDATVIGREGIEKLLTMLPTEEEKIKIQEAQYANPDLPLGSAEQFLLTLASISELSCRLKLWVFKLDFENSEKEIAEPLMDLKQGIEQLKINKTFKAILTTLRTVGSFLNGSQVKGFRLEYLSKVMEVKDTVHKHPLLHHICEMIIEKFPDTTDFFSEVGAVIRSSKIDFDMLSSNLMKLETDCKASWDHMKRVAKHDGPQLAKTKINDFLKDAAERIIILSIVKKKVMNRYNKFLLYLGVPPLDVDKTKPTDFLKCIADFALEYRTSRERVLQQLEKRANHRERNKTRGKMISEVSNNYVTTNCENSADNTLKELLLADIYYYDDSLTRGRKQSTTNTNPIITDNLKGDEEILESLVRLSSSSRKPVSTNRKRARLSDKRILNRTLDGRQS